MKLKNVVFMFLPLLFITGYFIQPTSAGIIRRIGIALYWDEECTNPVSSIDFGTLARGHVKSVTFWLKSQRTDKGRISWGSANFNSSTDGITEFWERKVGRFNYISNWHKKIKTEDSWEVHYAIQVAHDIQVGAYSWDLVVCHTSHKSLVNCLFIACILIVT